MTATVITDEVAGKREQTVEVGPEIFDRVYELITPTQAFRKVPKDIYHLVARIVLKYPDGAQREVFVRDWGKNPALVSFDDEQYFLADAPNVGAGASELVGLLLGLRKPR